jgi:LPS sulfotransferase NodH
LLCAALGRCGVEPMEVVYKEFVEDYAGTVVWLLEGIGVSIPENFAVAEPKMRRQADELSEEWVHLYNERTSMKLAQKG